MPPQPAAGSSNWIRTTSMRAVARWQASCLLPGVARLHGRGPYFVQVLRSTLVSPAYSPGKARSMAPVKFDRRSHAFQFFNYLSLAGHVIGDRSGATKRKGLVGSLVALAVQLRDDNFAVLLQSSGYALQSARMGHARKIGKGDTSPTYL
ncbi:uncharacterized protein [Triticum aestivum]|uniref:uncharacterized protein n=1 Tax=Triticum aestivum TaxID=4565 RepID=UPI001D00E2B2|nr:uncharacterized protein LOC123052898 [Triticum aestivum]